MRFDVILMIAFPQLEPGGYKHVKESFVRITDHRHLFKPAEGFQPFGNNLAAEV